MTNVMITKALRNLAKTSLIDLSQNPNNENITSDILSQEFLSPLEEVRLVIEEIVVPKKIAVDLFPQTSMLRKQQHEIVAHYQLDGITVGKSSSKRLRIFPKQ